MTKSAIFIARLLGLTICCSVGGASLRRGVRCPTKI
jgi:hypothetical protein